MFIHFKINRIKRYFLFISSIFIIIFYLPKLSFAFLPPQNEYIPKRKPIDILKKIPKEGVTLTTRKGWNKFKDKYGNKWQIRYSKETGLPEALLGSKTGQIADTGEEVHYHF